MSYRKERISIKEFFEKYLTKDDSIKALRTRANEDIFVFVGLKKDGRTRLYDNQLSYIRFFASKESKNTYPTITWVILKRVFIRLDSQNININDVIINYLNDGTSEEEAKKNLEKIILNDLKNNGHLD